MGLLPTPTRERSASDQMIRAFSSSARGVCWRSPADERMQSLASRLLKQSVSSGGYYLLACGLQQESRHEEALEAFRETIRLEGSVTADVFLNYGVSLELFDVSKKLQTHTGPRGNSIRQTPKPGRAWAQCWLDWVAGKTPRLVRNALCDWLRT